MKSFVAFLAVLAVAAADVSHIVNNPEAAAETIEEVNNVDINQFQYGFKTSNGIVAQEQGALKGTPEGEAVAVQGSNSYTAPDGEQISLTYIADENGYQPQGAHLPTPPAPEPIPDYILRSIEFNKANAPKQEAGLRN